MKCPKCGGEATNTIKVWTVSQRKSGGESGTPKLLGIFECLNCKSRFRAFAAPESKAEETVSIMSMVNQIKIIKGELMQTLKNLREKIKTLETERANLIAEIEKLKKAAESKVNALESEVNMLREEVKSLRDLLGYTEEK